MNRLVSMNGNIQRPDHLSMRSVSSTTTFNVARLLPVFEERICWSRSSNLSSGAVAMLLRTILNVASWLSGMRNSSTFAESRTLRSCFCLCFSSASLRVHVSTTGTYTPLCRDSPRSTTIVAQQHSVRIISNNFASCSLCSFGMDTNPFLFMPCMRHISFQSLIESRTCSTRAQR